jgi:hypothetical protein
MIEDLKKLIEDQEKKFQELLTTLSTSIESNHAEAKKMHAD